MEKLSYSQYQKKVRASAWKKYSERYGICDLVISSVISMVIGLLTKSLSIALMTLGCFFIIYSIIYLYYFAKEHIVIYNDQQHLIETFWPQELRLNVCESDVHEIKDTKGNIVPTVSFEIVNEDKKRKITELEVKISHLNHHSLANGEPMTITFLVDQNGLWDNGERTIELRPEDRARFSVAYLLKISPEVPMRVCFGEGLMVNYLFEREAVYQIALKFSGKLEGEEEFRTTRISRVVYSNPAIETLCSSDFVRGMSFYSEMPKPFIEVIETADKGYWKDYSSPARRQWEEEQKKARNEKVSSSPSKLIL